MNTTETNRREFEEWETYCDECYYHLWRVRRKNERGFNDGYHVHDGEEAKALVDLLNKQERELNAARRLAEKYRNLSCEDQDEADETLLPWETTNQNEL